MTNLMRSMPGDVVQPGQADRLSRVRATARSVFVAVDRLAQQRDLAASLLGQLAGFGRDVRGRPALLRPAHHADDAIRAELVAADHDPHERLIRRRPHRPARAADRSFRSSRTTSRRLPSWRARLTATAPAAAGSDLLDAAAALPMSWPGADDQVDVRSPLENQLLVLLRHAAQDADHLVRMAPLGCT